MNEAIPKLLPEHERYLNGSQKVMQVSMLLIYSILCEMGVQINDIHGRTKTIASILNNIMQAGKETTGEDNDINAMTIISKFPLNIVRILDNYKYNGITLFLHTEKEDKNYINEPFIKREKSNGYSAYHMTRKINPKFIQNVIENIKLKMYSPGGLDHIEKIFQEIYRNITTVNKNEMYIIISQDLDYWFEIHLQDFDNYYISEFGTASHGAYKSFDSIFKLMLQTENCDSIYQRFKLLTILSNPKSSEYKICDALIFSNSEQNSLKTIEELANKEQMDIWSFLKDYADYVGINLDDLFSMSKEELQNYYDEMESSNAKIKINDSDSKEICIIKILKFMTLCNNVSENIREEFYENLNSYAKCINIDLNYIIKCMSTEEGIKELKERYGIDVTDSSNPDIAIIRILKQMTLFKELSVIMRSDNKTVDDIFLTLLEWNKNIPINSEKAIFKFFTMLGWDEDSIVFTLDTLKQTNEEIAKNNGSLSKILVDRISFLKTIISNIREAKCEAHFYQINASTGRFEKVGPKSKLRILNIVKRYLRKKGGSQGDDNDPTTKGL